MHALGTCEPPVIPTTRFGTSPAAMEIAGRDPTIAHPHLDFKVASTGKT